MKLTLPTLCLLALAATAATARCGSAVTPSTPAEPPTSTYGPFGLLDHRSAYGQGAFPEPFLVDDSDEEKGEARMDWFHSAAGSSHNDAFTEEIEKGFGVVTLELEVHEERDHVPGFTQSGFDNLDVGARAPVWQYVSKDGFLDSTFGVGFEAGIPVHSQFSQNAEIVPKVFNDLVLGGHFTLQSIVGYSMLRGPQGADDEGGLNTFEYGFVLGYTIDHTQINIPEIQQIIPVFEVDGEKTLDNGQAEDNSVLGNAAIRLNLNSIGAVQPRLGVGFVFPMTNAAREDTKWGIYTSMVFEF